MRTMNANTTLSTYHELSRGMFQLLKLTMSPKANIQWNAKSVQRMALVGAYPSFSQRSSTRRRMTTKSRIAPASTKEREVYVNIAVLPDVQGYGSRLSIPLPQNNALCVAEMCLVV